MEALANMASRSCRSQADLGAALNKYEIALSPEEQNIILELLLDAGRVDRVIHLGDGGILLTVTEKGLQGF